MRPFTEIDVDGLDLGVFFHPIHARFTAPTGLLETTQRHLGAASHDRVDPEAPGPNLARHLQRLADILRPDRRRQPINRVIGQGDCFLKSAEPED